MIDDLWVIERLVDRLPTFSVQLLYELQNNVAQGLHAAPSGLDLGDITNRTTRLTEGDKRKNWLFSHTPSVALASAAIYSLIKTAKANATDLIEICLDVVS
jgi:hypothetical protein